MRTICSALCAVAAVAYGPHRYDAATARRATNAWTGSARHPWNPISEDRVFEVCYLDEAGEHIEECVCESEAELIEKGPAFYAAKTILIYYLRCRTRAPTAVAVLAGGLRNGPGRRHLCGPGRNCDKAYGPDL